MTALTDLVRVIDELRECCGKQLNTRLIQLHGQEALRKCDEGKILEIIKLVAVIRGPLGGSKSQFPCSSSRGSCTARVWRG